MDTRKIAREYRLATWAQIARERSESGQSVRDFCRSRGIHENTYYHRQQQLSASSGWSAVAEVEPPAQSATLTVEVGAFRGAVSAETDEKLLTRTRKTLVTLAERQLQSETCSRALKKTDMRKSVNGLMMLVEQSFKLDPFDEAVFVFCIADTRSAVFQAARKGAFPVADRGAACRR